MFCQSKDIYIFKQKFLRYDISQFSSANFKTFKDIPSYICKLLDNHIKFKLGNEKKYFKTSMFSTDQQFYQLVVTHIKAL